MTLLSEFHLRGAVSVFFQTHSAFSSIDNLFIVFSYLDFVF
jgi:hypothetical protein